MHWVFLRGLGRQSGHWFRFRQLLETEQRARRRPFDGQLHFPDLPGTGQENHRRSPTSIGEITDDVRSRTAAILPQEEKRCLFAISLGGMVALDWLHRYPGDFDHAFIVNSSVKGLSPFYHRMQLPAARGLMKGIYRGVVGRDIRALERTVLEWSCNTTMDDGKLERWVELQREYPMAFGNFLRQLLAALRFKAPQSTGNSVAGGQSAPVFLVSRKDRLVNPSCSDALFKRYGKPGQYFVHPFAGHDLTTDDPEGTLDFLRRYLSSVDA